MKTQIETMSNIRYLVYNQTADEYVAAIMGTENVHLTNIMENALKLDNKLQAEVIRTITEKHYSKFIGVKAAAVLLILKVTTSVEIPE